VNNADPSIVIGLLLMGMGVGAFISREFYRRNLQTVIEEEIEKEMSLRALSIESHRVPN